MAIEKISIDMKSNSEEIAKQLSKIDSKIKQLKIEKSKVQSSVKKLEKSLSEFKGFSFIEDAANSIESGATALKEVNDKVPSDLSKIGPKLGNMGIAIVGMGTLAVIAGTLASGDGKKAQTGFKTIRDIGKLLGESAETMSQIAAKVPSDLGSMGSRLGNMGIAIVGMGALVAIAGKLASGDAKVAKTGFKTIRDIGKLLEEAAETMSQIAAKVPSDLGSMGARLGNMGIAIVGMGVLVGIAGKLAQDNPKEAKKGFQMIREIGKLLEEAAETMSQIAAKVPADLGEMGSRLGSMGIAIVGMGVLVGIAGKLAQGNPKEAKKGFQMIREIGKLLEEAAETMSQIATKVPSDFGEMGSRLGSMGIAIGGMGILIAIAGKLAQDNPKEAKKGFQMIREIGKLLEEAAETMSQIVAKVPSDFGEMGSRLGSMGIAIGGMGLLIAIAGKLAKDNPKEAKKGFQMIREIGKLLEEAAETMSQIATKVPSDFGEMGSRLGSMGIAIGGMGVLVAIAGKLAKDHPKEAKAGFKMIRDLSSLLGETAEAMGQIAAKVPGDFGSLGGKLLAMGAAIGGMGLLVGVVGLLAEKKPDIAMAGLESIGGIISLLTKAAEAMKQIDEKVPDDIANVAAKLANIGIAIGGMSVLVGVVGALVSSGVGALIAGAGLATVFLVAEELMHVSEALYQLEQKVPDDTSSIKGKIESVTTAIGYFTAANLGGVLDLFKNAVGALNTAVVAEGIIQLAKVGKELQKFEDITIPANIESKINEIQSVFEYLKKGVGFFKEIGQFFSGGKTDTKIGEDAAKAVGNLADVAKAIEKLEETEIKDPEGLKDRIEEIQKTFEYFTKTKGWFDDVKRAFKGDNIDDGVAEDAKNYVTHLVGIMEQLDKIQKTELNFSDVISKLQNVQDIIKGFEKIDLNMKLDVDTLKATVEKAEYLSKLIGHLKTAMGFTFDANDVTKLKETIKGIKEAIKEILSTDFTPRDENGTRSNMPDWTWAMERDIQQAIDKLGKLNELGAKLKAALKFEFDEGSFATFEDRVKLMQDTIRKVLLTDFSPTDENGNPEVFEAWDEKESVITKAVGKLTQLNLMGAQLEEALRFKFDSNSTKQFQDTMDEIVKAVKIVDSFKLEDTAQTDNVPATNSDNGLLSLADTKLKIDTQTEPTSPPTDEATSSNGDSLMSRIAEAKKRIEKVSELINLIQNVPQLNAEEFGLKIGAVKACLQKIQEFVTDKDAVANAEKITSSADAFTELADTLNGLLPKFTEFGNGFATNIMAEYKAKNPTKTIADDFSALITTLEGYYQKFTDIGTKYTENLTKGLIESIRSIPSEIKSVVDGMNMADSVIMTTFGSIGTRMGNSLVEGFKGAVEGLYVKVGATNKNKSLITPIYPAKGGLVPDYLASGGLAGIFKKKGTDTVPAMLTPGEFVQRRAAVSTFGLDFMNKVNNLDVRGAFSALTGRFNTQSMLIPAVSTVVNNVNHTTNNANRVTQNVVGGNADYIMKRASRYLR
ncbi:hypothetical protein [Enterococcus caccae]|uniref:Tape measure domain-containing protein n=1 Tax=Enterococcus caccae ATCC BAA-1240 TaxID=1158612 RepID=R3UB54_9ENTE|nr:hypothetical protein [Enterococcus caccae]EOL50643.1 hypothetical protein UC7_00094 [Enterococcus caccae ATCC BAA-1240]EOT59464.1 hypothetical protein I580_02496 [Enterococcus caccae ATCC BAA-1240]OJG27628.1 hypothetical protein RU98_GL002331 [Enterococcus caccae]